MSLVVMTPVYLCPAMVAAQGKTQKISKNLVQRAEDMTRGGHRARASRGPADP